MASRPAEGPELRTARLLLRRWTEADREPFAAINADPDVMRCLLGPMPREDSDAMIDRIEEHFERRGFGFWAVEVLGGPALVGMVGLAVVGFEAHFAPAVEIGWRLASDQWGRGYATEAAAEAMRFGFDDLALKEIVAFTLPGNVASRAVMERLGMTHDPADDFEHPKLPEGHPFRRHVLYRATNPANEAM